MEKGGCNISAEIRAAILKQCQVCFTLTGSRLPVLAALDKPHGRRFWGIGSARQLRAAVLSLCRLAPAKSWQKENGNVGRVITVGNIGSSERVYCALVPVERDRS